MHADPVLARISEELTGLGAHTILLYGSRADDSAGPASDYDIAAFAPIAESRRVARLESGAYLDVFIHPDAELAKPAEEHLKLRGSRILLQRGTEADAFLLDLEAIFLGGPVPLPEDEIQARRVWALKMLARIERADPEGNYRRAWLLQALLEDYFHIRRAWYEGPKKSLRWLEQFDPSAYAAFCLALEPGASNEAIASLVQLVVGPPATSRSDFQTR
jgi:hypothetical protein